MTERAMNLDEQTLAQIGGYVRRNLASWIAVSSPILTIEAADKRFDAADRRFAVLLRVMSIGFAVLIPLVVTILGALIR